MEKSAKYVRLFSKLVMPVICWLMAALVQAQPTAFTQLVVPKPMPVFSSNINIDISYYTPSFVNQDSLLYYSSLDASGRGRRMKTINTSTKIANSSPLGFFNSRIFDSKQFIVGHTIFAPVLFPLRDSILALDLKSGQSLGVKKVMPPYTSYFRNGQDQVRIMLYFEDDLYRKYVVDTFYNSISIFDTSASRLFIERKSDGFTIKSNKLISASGGNDSKVCLTDSLALYFGLDYGDNTFAASGSTVIKIRKNSSKIDTIFDAFEAKRVGGYAPRLENLVSYRDRMYCVSKVSIRGFKLSYFNVRSYTRIYDTLGLAANEMPFNAFVHNDSLFLCTDRGWYKKHITSNWERLPWPAYPGDWVGWAGGTVWSNGISGIRYLENGVWKEPENRDQQQSFQLEQVNGNQLTIQTGGVRYYSPDAGNNWRRIPSNSIFAQQFRVPTVLPGVILTSGQSSAWCNYDSLRTNAFVTPQGLSTTGAEGRALLVQGQLVALFNPSSVNNSIRISRSTDLGRTWVSSTVLALGQGRVDQFFGANDVIFVQIGTQSLWRSADLGQSWTQVTGFPLISQPVVVASGHGQNMLINYHNKPFFSSDNGLTFTNWQTPRNFNSGEIRTCMNQHGIYSGDRELYYKPTPASNYIRLYTPIDTSRLIDSNTPFVSGDQLYITNNYQLFRATTTANFHLTSLDRRTGDTMKLYPNPVPHGQRQVRVNTTESTLLLYNLTGQLLGELEVNDGLVNLPDLSPGLYLLKGNGMVRLVVE